MWIRWLFGVYNRHSQRALIPNRVAQRHIITRGAHSSQGPLSIVPNSDYLRIFRNEPKGLLPRWPLGIPRAEEYGTYTERYQQQGRHG